MSYQTAEGMSALEERFQAAVNVIRGLPKNGSYQPSNEMMLRFYSYFKQATQGPCTQKKPAFWDMVNRAKWESWQKLGDMPMDRAMQNYVEELKKIIETMSYTDNVANFMGSINELEGINVDDLEAVAPDAIKKVRSQPNSPFASRESSPIRQPSLQHYTNGSTTTTSPQSALLTNGGSTNGYSSSASSHANGYGHEYANQNGFNGSGVDYSDDEYIDTVDDESEIMGHRYRNGGQMLHNSRPKLRSSLSNDTQTTVVNSTAELFTSRDKTNLMEVLVQLNKTVERMNVDVSTIVQRVDSYEKTIQELIKSNRLAELALTQQRKLQKPVWWPFDDISPKWFIFMICWPLITQRLVKMLDRRRK